MHPPKCLQKPSPLLLTMSTTFLLLSNLIILSSLTSSAQSDEYHYQNCSSTFKCGSLQANLAYPFWSDPRPDYCGHPAFKLACPQNGPVTIEVGSQTLQVINIDMDTKSMTVSWPAFFSDPCPRNPWNITLDHSIFNYTLSSTKITFFYNCSSIETYEYLSRYTCPTSSYFSGKTAYYTQGSDTKEEHCKVNVVVSMLRTAAESVGSHSLSVEDGLKKGFEVNWVGLEGTGRCSSCVVSEGVCGYELESKNTTCFCRDGVYSDGCSGSSSRFSSTAPTDGSGEYATPASNSTPSSAAITVGSGIVLGLLILLSFCVVRKCKSVPKNQRVEDMLKNYESLVPKRYTYANITKITNSFREKLGEGGYGTVFKGKLQDSRLVAVKVSKQSKGDGHEFANEVVSICSTSHINVVPLLGFCFEGHKGALLYEFMPNGSLEKFIRRRDFNKNDQALSFQKLFEIAVGIARGLEYLHRDCNTRIVHFDIKPHNILLDEDFIPKISDFGLAKPFKQKESIISISGARGTAGYIAPEVFFSNYGGASNKSDVYSYGMMVLEMVGCTKRPDENVENSSELYFPQWIYKQLEQGATVNCVGRVLNDEDKELERKMVLVGLWCIQTNPRSRPSMRRVLGMLEGEVELEVPPMPSLASPSWQQQQQPTDDGSASFLSSTSYAS